MLATFLYGIITIFCKTTLVPLKQQNPFPFVFFFRNQHLLTPPSGDGGLLSTACHQLLMV